MGLDTGVIRCDNGGRGDGRIVDDGRMDSPMARPKDEIITFKADASLLEAMRGIPNRSAFIRAAILAALESTCPLCQGTGVLTPEQQQHWDDFAVDHAVVECEKCHVLRVVCTNRRDGAEEHVPKTPMSKRGTRDE